MPRPRKSSDEPVFEAALALMQERGSDALTFALLSERCGLSGSTLVQRYGSKRQLIHAALVHAWDALEERTRRIASEEPKTPGGAVTLLCRLSTDYGDIESYADKLHILREDFRHPDLRARGQAWVRDLAALIEQCFSQAPPSVSPDIGTLMIGQWQGALLLWGFSPDREPGAYIRGHLDLFLKSLEGIG